MNFVWPKGGERAKHYLKIKSYGCNTIMFGPDLSYTERKIPTILCQDRKIPTENCRDKKY